MFSLNFLNHVPNGLAAQRTIEKRKKTHNELRSALLEISSLWSNISLRKIIGSQRTIQHEQING